MLHAPNARSARQERPRQPPRRGPGRLLLAGGIGIAALFAACIAILWLQGSGEAPAGASAAAPLEVDQAAVRQALEAAAAAQAKEGPPAPLDQQPAVSQLPPLPGRPATGVIPRAQPHRMPRGSPAPVEFFAGLRELQASVDRCAQEGRAGGLAAAPGAQAVFLLDIETLDRRVRIVDAPLQRGDAPSQVVACAQGVLLGHEIPVRVSQPGNHFRMPLVVKL